jgi:hypothetical protein
MQEAIRYRLADREGTLLKGKEGEKCGQQQNTLKSAGAEGDGCKYSHFSNLAAVILCFLRAYVLLFLGSKWICTL